MPIFAHSGRFDTRFLGVLIRSKSMAELESFRFMDRSASLPAEQLVRLPMDAFITDLSRLTVLDHEIRHFHDALLYPFGAAALREQVVAAGNGLGVGWAVSRSAGAANVLPVPLQEWLMLPAPRRARFLEQQAGGPGRQPIPPDLPALTDDDLQADLPRGAIDLEGAAAIKIGCRAAIASYRALEDLWRAPHPPGEAQFGSSAVLWEVPGTLSQLAAIHRIADLATMQRFAGWLLNDGPPRYRRGFEVLQEISPDPEGIIRDRATMALAAWSQMGRFKTETRASSPGGRLDRLWAARKRGLRWTGEEPFLDLVARWDETIGRDSLADLDDSTRELGLLVDRYARRTAVETHPGSPWKRVTAALQAYHRAHLTMKQAFLREPDTFVDPVTYVERRSIYPQPAVALSYTEMLEAGETKQDWLDATPATWRPAIEADVAFNLGSLVELADALFLPSARTLESGARRWIRQYLGLEPLRLIVVPP
jgi:hypothetical protein